MFSNQELRQDLCEASSKDQILGILESWKNSPKAL